VSAGQAAGTHCALSEFCVGTTTQRGSCDLGCSRYGLGRKVAANCHSERVTRKQEVYGNVACESSTSCLPPIRRLLAVIDHRDVLP